MAVEKKSNEVDLNPVEEVLEGDSIYNSSSRRGNGAPLISDNGQNGHSIYSLSEKSEIDPEELEGKKTVFFYDFEGDVSGYEEDHGIEYPTEWENSDFRPRTSINFRHKDGYIGFEGKLSVTLGGVPDSFEGIDSDHIRYRVRPQEGLTLVYATEDYGEMKEALEEVLELAEELSTSYLDKKPVGRMGA